jgi:hypothetical protein
MHAIAASPLYPVRSTVMALKAMGALLYCGDHRVRPIMMGRVANPGAVIPVSAVRPRSERPSTSTSGSPTGASHEPERHLTA